MSALVEILDGNGDVERWLAPTWLTWCRWDAMRFVDEAAARRAAAGPLHHLLVGLEWRIVPERAEVGS